MKRIPPHLVAIVLCSPSAGVLAAQHATLPSAAAARDGTGVGFVPGFDRGGREQFVIGAGMLSAAIGRNLRALTFRRDGFEAPLGGGVCDLVLSMSIYPHVDPRAPSSSFAANRGSAPVEVFRGRVSLPTSPRLAHRDAAAWSFPDVVTIDFDQPWTYPGGHLCIEIVGQPHAGAESRYWAIDTEVEGGAGQRGILGTGCGAAAARANPAASVDVRQLRPGATARFTTVGEPGATAFLLLATSALPTPIDLGPFGAPGCQLWLLPEVVLPGVVGASRGGRPAAARCDLSLPALPSFVGAALAAQWLTFGTALATSNALDLSLGTLPASLAGSSVHAVFGVGEDREVGLVQVGTVPVLRVHW